MSLYKKRRIGLLLHATGVSNICIASTLLLDNLIQRNITERIHLTLTLNITASSLIIIMYCQLSEMQARSIYLTFERNSLPILSYFLAGLFAFLPPSSPSSTSMASSTASLPFLNLILFLLSRTKPSGFVICCM
jgi:hypothetical protein